MKRIAIIGGGASGLAAAFALEKKRRQGAACEYVLFESSPRLGGVIRTEQVDDCRVEAGPDSFLSERPGAAELCHELGLGDQLIASNDAERKTYIFTNQRLIPLPDGMMFMVPTRVASTFFSPLFSWKTKLSIIREYFYPPSASASEATVAELVERHYGREMLDRVADPLMAGIYGGSADELSASSVVPPLAEIDRRSGSLGRALMRSRPKRAPDRHPLFTSLKDGMQQLTDTIARKIPEGACRVAAAVTGVSLEGSKWLVGGVAAPSEVFDGAIIATPAWRASGLLTDVNRDLASLLGGVRYSSSVLVALGYDKELRSTLPPGFGFLVPRRENCRLLAVTFVHNKFPQRVPEDRALLRCFLGGSRDEPVLELSEDQIQAIVLSELRRIAGIEAEPRFLRVYKWSKVMAQYGVGHRLRVEGIQKLVSSLPGLALAGNAYGGIGLSDCFRSGAEAASKVLGDLQLG